MNKRFETFRVMLALAVLQLLAVAHAGQAPAAPGDYTLGGGDLLRVVVSGYPELGSDVRVSQSGSISLPYLGQLPVAGLPTGEVETLIAKRLVDGAIVRQPQVSVLVVEYESQKVAVMGQVGKPGQYPLAGARRLIDLLAEAGGPLNETASDRATLLRKDGSKVDIDLQALFNGDATQNPAVSGGDTIVVPKAPQFYVYGAVQKPGVYRLERNMTVSQAISAGGGLTLRGSDRRVVVKRRTPSGKEQSKSVRGADMVVADDVLMVKEALF